ncbi:MAG: 30S ribosomal protein S4 [Candidatus Omnitrophica bacterium CG1_02_44_16]|nr:MAG: 30S ribosomal protein S4 [Candidatus Omnitrophica bacterium CG1_02_44_16]PIY82800.1 MAG: 30S ribosomal protein S4 [Candidatus Omnitrophica bacterium CG_4_10_14_0_8_um_filter_44_12]PIZ84047.1 MAG: 30S ribosomal protein S4 [Candidatus Omnitrophica bacterium CG_4_10_14_0_2_um_filter_44_9]
MAKYTGPSCRLCRREMMKLFLKGPRCHTDKCGVARRAFPPGQHGQARGTKLSNYGIQLREKQKVKRIYGVMERQFRRYFAIASKSKGVTGKVLLQELERRLDNVIFRLMFATSHVQARQIVRHGAIYVNDQRVNIPSFSVKQGDEIEVRGKEGIKKVVKVNIDLSKDRGVAPWLEADLVNLKARVLRLPDREDIQMPIQEQLIVELYSK